MKSLKLKLIFLFLINGLIWISVYQSRGNTNLRVIACDVGQGDAILITLNKSQVLIDGGPGGKVIDCLSTYMPFWDRKIELVILTHPQLDHYEGLIKVFEIYKVDTFLANSLVASSQSYKVLENEVGGSQARVINPQNDLTLRLGMMYLDILHPGSEFITSNSTYKVGKTDFKSENMGVLGASETKLDPNEFSIVTLLKFKEFKALFTGDAGPELSDSLANRGNLVDVDYIKIPHHGSKNGVTEKLLDVTSPIVAVISSGKKNNYGHPNKEVIDMLKARNIEIFRTDEIGDVIIETDGTNIEVGP